jgi:hypothetical protein
VRIYSTRQGEETGDGEGAGATARKAKGPGNDDDKAQPLSCADGATGTKNAQASESRVASRKEQADRGVVWCGRWKCAGPWCTGAVMRWW